MVWGVDWMEIGVWRDYYVEKWIGFGWWYCMNDMDVFQGELDIDYMVFMKLLVGWQLGGIG